MKLKNTTMFSSPVKRTKIAIISAVFVGIAMLLPQVGVQAQNCTVNAGVEQIVCSNADLYLYGSKAGLFQGTGQTTWTQYFGPSVNILSPNSLSTMITGIQPNTTYKFRISSTCQDGSLIYDTVSVKILPVTVANAGQDLMLCPGTHNLQANSPLPGEIGSWSIVGNGVGITLADPTNPNSAITLVNDLTDSYTLRWTIINPNGCSSYDEVTITNMGGISPVNAGPDQFLGNCYSYTAATSLDATYAGNGTGGQLGTWTVVSGPNMPLFGNPNLRNTSVSNLIQGTYILRWTASGPCVSASDDMIITVPPPVGTVTFASITSGNQVFCTGVTTAVLSGTPPTYIGEMVEWTQIGGPPCTITDPNSPTTTVTGLDGVSTYRFIYTILNKVNNCSSVSASRTIRFVGQPTINAGPDQILPAGATTVSIPFTFTGGNTTAYSVVSYPAGYTPPAGWQTVFSPLSVTNLNVVGTYVFRFRRYTSGGSAGCTDAYDDVTVYVSRDQLGANAGTDQMLACNIGSTALAGNTPPTGYGTWTQISGPGTAVFYNVNVPTSAVSGLVSGVYIFCWTITGGVNSPSYSDYVRVTVANAIPVTANAGPDQSVCYNTPVILSGSTPALNEVGMWSVVPSTGVVFSNIHAPNASVSGLQANTVYTFTWTITNACGSASDQVVITTGSQQGPVQANAGSNQCLSAGTVGTTLSGNNPSPATGLWTKLSGPSCSIVNPAQYNTAINGMSSGTYAFIWTISQSGCGSTSDTVLVTIAGSATIANAGPDQSICGTSTLLAGNIPSTGTGLWTLISGPVGSSITAPSSANSAFTGLTDGTYTLRWTISNGACPANFDEVNIVACIPPTAANAGPDQSICGNTTTVLAANTITNGTGTWSVISAPSSPVISDVHNPAASVSGLQMGTYVLQWTSASGIACTPSSDQVSIFVSANANAGNDQNLCNVTSAQLTGNISSTGTWTLVSGPNTPVIAPIGSNSASVSGLVDGVYTFAYTINSGFCPATSDLMTVTVFSLGSAPDAGPDQQLCNASAINLNGNTPIVGSGMWTLASGPTGGIFSPGINSPSVAYTGAVPGIYLFNWTISSGACILSDQIRVDNYEAPTPAQAGADQSVCALTTSMSANSPVVGVGNWTQISGPATAVISNPIMPNSVISVPSSGVYVFRWTISNGACTPTTDDVQLTFATPPTAPNAGADQSLCGGTAAMLSANTPAIGTGNWSFVSGPSTPAIATPSNPSTMVSGLQTGTYVFRWTTTNGSCSLTDDVQVLISQNPSTANAGTDQSVCNYSTISLNGNVPVSGTGLWSQVSGPNTAVISNPSFSNATVTGTIPGTYVFAWIISNGSCTPASDNVQVVVHEIPSLAVAGSDQSGCNLTSATMSATAPAIGTGTWTIVSGPGSPVFSNVSAPNAVVSGLVPGTYVFRWTVANGPCSLSDDVTLQNDNPPSVANAGADQNVCGVSIVTLSGNIPSVGMGTWSVVSGPGSPVIDNPSAAVTSVSGLLSGVYVFRYTVSAPGCSPNSDDVQVNTASGPSTALAGIDQTLPCGVNSTSLSANVPAFGTGSWSIVSGTGGSIANVSDPNSTFSGMSGMVYILRWTITLSGCTSTDDVQITIPAVASPADAGPDQTLACGNNTTTLAGNNPVSGTGSWTILSGNGGNVVSPSSPSGVFSGQAGQTYILRWTISAGACTSADEVQITIPSVPSTANAGADQSPSCGVTSISLSANAPSVGSGLWTIVSGTGGNLTLPASPTSGFSGLAGQTYTLRWTISSGTCTSADEVQIAFQAVPDPANAGPDQTLACGNTTTNLTANNPISGTGNWSILSGNGGSLAVPSSAVSTFSGQAGQTYILRWTISAGACTSTDEVQIIVPAIPTTSNAGSDQTLACGINSTTLAGNNPTNGTGGWSILSGTGGSFANASSAVSGFTGQFGQTYILSWTITSGTCTSTDEVQISIPFNPSTANAGTDQTLACGTTTTNLAGNSAASGTGSWSILSGSGGSFANASSAVSGFTGQFGQTYILRWTISAGACTSTDEVQIIVPAIPTTSNAGTDQTLACGINSTTLAGNNPTNGTGSWSILSGTGGSFANASSAVSGFTGQFGQTYILSWNITSGACTTTDEVQISIPFNPTTSNAGSDQTLACGTTTTNLAGNSPASGTGSWSILSGIGGSITNPALPMSNFSGQSGQTYILRWTIASGSCTSADDVQITIPMMPTAANAGVDQNAPCGITTVTLAANAATVGSGLWSVVSGNGGIFADATNPLTSFTGLPGETYILQWRITVGSCFSEDVVVVVLSAAPGISNAGPDQTLACGVVSATLAGNVPSAGTGNWILVSGTGGVIADPANPVSGFSGLAGQTYLLRWRITLGSCSSTDDVQIIIPQNPSSAIAGTDQNVSCGTSTVTLNANSPASGSGMWSVVSGSGGSFADVQNPSTTFSGLPGQIYTLSWTVTLGPCHNSDNVQISYQPAPTVAHAGTDQTLTCGSVTTALAANTASSGSGLWSILSGTGGSFADASLPNTAFTGVAGQSYLLRWTISIGGCTSVDDVLIIIPQNPTTANAGADQYLLCGVGGTTLSANIPSVGTGAWSIVSGTGGVIADPANPQSSFSGLAGQTYTLRWTITSGSCSSFDDVQIGYQLTGGFTANAGPDQTLPCGIVTAYLSANFPGSANGTWSVVSGNGGSFNNFTNPNTYFNGVSGETYILRWTVTDGTCTVFDEVQIVMPLMVTISNAGSDQTVSCGQTTTVMSANTPIIGTGTWSVITGTGGSFSAVNNPYTNFTGQQGQMYILRWTISNGVCVSSDDVQVFIPQDASPANAGPDLVLNCGTVSTPLGAAAPLIGSGVWSVVSGVGGTFANIYDPGTIFNGYQGQTYILKWTVTNGVCSNSDFIQVIIPQGIPQAYAGPDQVLSCGATATTLNALTPVLGTGFWTIVSGLNGTVTIPASPSSSFTGMAGETYILRWTVTHAGCTTSDDVQIIIPMAPSVADAGADQTLACGSLSTMLQASMPSTGSGSWLVVSGAGSIISNLSDPNAYFSGVAGQTYILLWSVSYGACTSSDQVMITVPQAPVSANAGPDLVLSCGSVSTLLGGNHPGTGNGLWTVVSGNGGTFANPVNPAALFTGVSGETYVLRWSITLGTCTAYDEVIITLPVAPANVYAGPDQNLACGQNITQLAASVPQTGTGLWTIIAGNGGQIADPADPNSQFTGIPGQSYILQWNVATPGCQTGDQLQINIPQSTALANAGTSQTLACGVASTYLNAVAPTQGSGSWTIISGTGGSLNSFTNPTAWFTGVPGQDYILVWTITASGCTSSDTVSISLPSVPTPADAGPSQTLSCGNLTTTLSANTPVSGSGQWTIVSGNGGIIANPGSSNSQFNGQQGQVYTLVWTIVSGVCTSSDTMIVDMNTCLPVAVDDLFTIPEDQILNGTSLLANDYDPTGYTLSIVTTPVTLPANGTVVINANGTFVYTPLPNFNGTDSFSYRMCNSNVPPQCDVAVVTIVVTPVNDPPVIVDPLGNATDTIYDSTQENTPLNICVLSIEPDGDVVSLSFVTLPSNGQVSGAGSGDTCFTYTPGNGFTGNDSIVVVLCDNGIPTMCDTLTIVITVIPGSGPQNNPPLALPDHYTTNEDTYLLAPSVLVNDSDPDNNNLNVTTLPVVSTAHGSLILYYDGTFEYFPDLNYYGPDSFQYRVYDNGVPSKSDTGTAYITVLPVNDPPVIVDGSGNSADTLYFTTNNYLPMDICIQAIDPDTNEYFITNWYLPSNGTINVSATGDSCFTYTPDPGFTGNDTLGVFVCDNGFPTMCDTATIIITVLPGMSNIPPIAGDDVYNVPEDDTLNASTVLANDTDPNGNNIGINASPVTPPTHGSVTINPDGSFVYIPDADYFGPDSFEYVICDDGVPPMCDTATVTINVLPVNDPPVALDSANHAVDTLYFTTMMNTPLFECIHNYDAENDIISLNMLNLPDNGLVNAGGFGDTCFVYNPNNGYIGGDYMIVALCDNGVPSLCDTVVVIFEVLPSNANLPPVIMDYSDNPTDTLYFVTDEDVPLDICLNVTDPNNDDLSMSTTYPPLNGNLINFLDGDTCFTYVPSPDYNGNDIYTLVVCDNGVPTLCDTVVIIMTVNPVNDPPVVYDSSGNAADTLYFTTIQNTALDICLNVVDPENDNIGLGILLLPDDGMLYGLVDGDTCFGYMPDNNFLGNDTVTFLLCDNGVPPLCDTVTLIITVVPPALPNHPPVIHDSLGNDAEVIWYFIDEGEILDTCLWVTDVDGDNLDMSLVGYPLNGNITNIGDGDTCYTYTPLDGFTGIDSVLVIVCDNGIPTLCDTVWLYFVVEPKPDEDLMIPEAFSPNGDGVNDLFVIPTIDEFPENQIAIFNRWGNKVFDAQPYKNDWNGKYQGKFSIGDDLPAGTYFYVLKLRPDSKPIKGYIYLGR